MASYQALEVASFTRWIQHQHPALAQRAESWFHPAPHAFDDDIVGYCVRMTDAEMLIAVIPDELLPASIAKAAPRRRSSFVAGRLCAERALAQLGHLVSVPSGPAGEPIWPMGADGSITHNELIACAAATSRAIASAMGIDSEVIVDEAGCPAIEQLCCTEQERVTWVHADNRSLAVTLIFSAKEAYYKAIFPIARRYVDFHEVEVTGIDWRRGELSLKPIPERSLAAQVPPALCRFRVDNEMVHTSVVLLQSK